MLKYLSTILLLLQFVLFSGCERELSSSYTYGREQSVTILSPVGGEVYTNNETVIVSWLSSNLNGKLRIELIREGISIYSVNSIPNSGNYQLRIPGEIIPSKKYQLKIEAMTNPEITAITQLYFEIAPLIDGEWYYSNLELDSGLEIRLQLTRVFNNAFLGNGFFHLRYFSGGGKVDYETVDTVGGSIAYPDISLKMREPGNKQFDFTGKMVTGSRIRGNISGFVDSVYGNINDSITLIRQ